MDSITKNNYYISTRANFRRSKRTFNRPSDFESGANSQYWYTEAGVYRKSNHWGGVSSCYWTLEDKSRVRGMGFCAWKDFEGSYLVKHIGNNVPELACFIIESVEDGNIYLIPHEYVVSKDEIKVGNTSYQIGGKTTQYKYYEGFLNKKSNEL